ncbi:MAG TPA: hypothetical protein VFF29_06360 [Bacteroidota bacterium]|nr:hypothetical protein [Bacteroidota bacterium]
MTHIIRNTIVLGVVLFLIVGAGYYFTMSANPKKLNTVNTEIKKLQDELQNTPDLSYEYNTKLALRDKRKKDWEERDKEIPPRDITGETYGYLSRLIEAGGEVKLNLTYESPVNFPNFGYNRYKLAGTAYFDNLFKFIWYIENGKRLFKISKLTMKEGEVKDSLGIKVFITYDMDVQAYYSQIQQLNVAPGQRMLAPTQITKNPFYPIIMENIPEIRPDEIDIRRSTLQAVITGKAFIIDQNQKPRTISEGDPVYLGYITKISPIDGKVEAFLNRGGVSERFELYTRVGQTIK